ncbi:MAG: hypothetical protein HRT89_12225 [Lentisphaeria bacterium]|nr:hypothetical protein [Lentisphaeria bacterium]NQZ68824.1 hypothetical protein [Lentisphaeria bacterium]
MTRKISLFTLLFSYGFCLNADDIALTIKNRSNADQKRAVVVSGIPFPVGKLKESNVSLIDSDGKTLPLHTRVTASWYDGSVKWLQLQTQVSLKAQESLKLKLTTVEKKTTLKNPWKEKDTEDALIVDNGKLKIKFLKQGNAFIQSLLANGRTVIKANGKAQMLIELDNKGPKFTDEENWLRPRNLEADTVTCKAKIESCHVDERTPFRYILRYEGGLYDSKDIRKCGFVLRFYLYRNSSEMKVEWTMIWEADARTNFLSNSLLRFPGRATGAKMNDDEMVKGSRVSVIATKSDVKVDRIPINQVKAVETYVMVNKKKMAAPKDSGWADIIMGGKKISVAAYRFHQRFPKELRVDKTGITYYMWPSSTDMVADLRNYRDAPAKRFTKHQLNQRIESVHGQAEGTATTERLYFDFSGKTSGADLKKRIEKRLLLQASPDVYLKSGVFGPVLPFSPEAFPEYEGLIEASLYWIIRSPDQYKWYGLFNDGGSLMEFNWARPGFAAGKNAWMCRGYSGWYMNDGGLAGNILLHYFRSGNTDYFDFAERKMNYVMDVVTIHAENDHSVRGASPNAKPTIGASRRHNEQSWGGYHSTRGSDAFGRFFYYHLTGEPRVLDVIVEGTVYEWVFQSSEKSCTVAGSLALSAELFAAEQKFDPLYEQKKAERLLRFQSMKNRAWRYKWKLAGQHSQRLYFHALAAIDNPAKLKTHGWTLDYKFSNVHTYAFTDVSVRPLSLKYFELTCDPNSDQGKQARSRIARAATAMLNGKFSQGDAYARFYEGKSAAFTYEWNKDEKWPKRINRKIWLAVGKKPKGLKAISLADGMVGGARNIPYLDLWNRLSVFGELTPNKIYHLWGMVLDRFPYMMTTLDIPKPKEVEIDEEVELIELD